MSDSKNMFSLAGKKAIVVGGAGDLGRSMVAALGEAGAQVVIIARGEKGERYAAAIEERGFDIGSVAADISERAQVDRSFDSAVERLGGSVDILVNAAGLQRRHRCEEFPMDDWAMVLEVNLTALWRYCQLAGRRMIPRGSGKIINIASMLSFFGGYTVPAYAASKGGVAQLTKALANEWAARGINVNAIAPGYMDTKMNENIVNDPGRNAEILERIPARRWGRGEDLKGVVVFLAGPGSDYINGAIIPVDGGYLGR